MSEPKDTGDLRDDTTQPDVPEISFGDIGPQSMQVGARVALAASSAMAPEAAVGPLSPAVRNAIDEARVAQLVACGGPLEGD